MNVNKAVRAYTSETINSITDHLSKMEKNFNLSGYPLVLYYYDLTWEIRTVIRRQFLKICQNCCYTYECLYNPLVYFNQTTVLKIKNVEKSFRTNCCILSRKINQQNCVTKNYFLRFCFCQ